MQRPRGKYFGTLRFVSLVVTSSSATAVTDSATRPFQIRAGLWGSHHTAAFPF